MGIKKGGTQVGAPQQKQLDIKQWFKANRFVDLPVITAKDVWTKLPHGQIVILANSYIVMGLMYGSKMAVITKCPQPRRAWKNIRASRNYKLCIY